MIITIIIIIIMIIIIIIIIIMIIIIIIIIIIQTPGAIMINMHKRTESASVNLENIITEAIQLWEAPC